MPARPTRRRLDHQPLYFCVITAQAAIAIVILSQAVYTTIYYWMSLLVETICASTLLLGALGCLFGMAQGTRYFRPGADIRDSYTIEAWSIVLIVISMIMFEVGIVRGGGQRGDVQMLLVLMTAVIIGLSWKAVDFNTEVRRLSAELAREVVASGGD